MSIGKIHIILAVRQLIASRAPLPQTDSVYVIDGKTLFCRSEVASNWDQPVWVCTVDLSELNTFQPFLVETLGNTRYVSYTDHATESRKCFLNSFNPFRGLLKK